MLTKHMKKKQQKKPNMSCSYQRSRCAKVDRWMAFTSLPTGMTSPLRQLKRIEHDVIASKIIMREGDYLYQVFAMQSSIAYLGKQSRFASIIVILLIILLY